MEPELELRWGPSPGVGGKRPLALDLPALRRGVSRLAEGGVFVGTSSWKYAGWQGMLYDRERYVWRGRYSENRFERHCLAEYAEVFQTVSVDAAYYRFPDRRQLESLVSQVPGDFQFGLKVTDEVTIRRFANLPRFGSRAGQPNPGFLNAELFARAFLGPLEPFRRNVGLVMFEFSRLHPADFDRADGFLRTLDAFLGCIPSGWPYAVEIRNRELLDAGYFEVLRRHEVAHLYNSWEAMPAVGDQLAMPGSRTHPGLCAARFLLKPGRRYEDAVKAFSPYDRIREANPEGRAAGAELMRVGWTAPPKARTYVFVNNRFEGNAVHTIQAMMEEAEARMTRAAPVPPAAGG